ncbi:CHAP domain-containing protein [Streptomyces europaeiscabiei]|uniref:CHAP domain-containing protein n=1 Tax=Streptomyces europaeiscabiei TaxID=146819 RepID=UPI0029A4D189|nr:CHAP domain-containing protein [Streptomyces europaeiscabiei]MDX3695959.1 CHAP domain-containing protein [Streptomyces europaeiscabiei]
MALGMMLTGHTVQAPPASADTWLCTGNSYSVCENKGFGNHGFADNNGNSYWGAFAGHNCTNYASYMASKNGASRPSVNLGNGGDWDTNAAAAGVLVDANPAVGAIAQFDPYVGISLQWGHVAYVEAVGTNASGQTVITISEDNYSTGPFSWRKITKGTNGWPSNFIHFADVGGATTPAPSPPPDPVPWNFEAFDGNGSPVNNYAANTGKTPTSVTYGDRLYVFSYDEQYGRLRYSYTSPTSPWVFGSLDGAGTWAGGNHVGSNPAAVVYNDYLHVFYYDATAGNLRHTWTNGVNWWFENLDGDPGSIGGHNSDLGQTPAAVVHNGTLQLFYYDAGNTNLRHAWLNSNGWFFENLEGDSGSVSHYVANLGMEASVTVYDNQLHVFYYDATAGNLRHARVSASGWVFENLDGDPGSVGGVDGNMGNNPVSVVHNNQMHVFYYSQTHGTYRHMWTSTTEGWQREHLIGNGDSSVPHISNIGNSSAAVSYSGTLQMFIYETSGENLVHLWNDGTRWRVENLDGKGGSPSGRLDAAVGVDPTVIVYGGLLHTFYYDSTNGDLRHAWPQ